MEVNIFKGNISYAEFRDKALSEEEIIKVYEKLMEV